MLAIRVRVRPWSEREARSSFGRATVRVLFFQGNLDRAGHSVAQLAFGTLDADDRAVNLDLNAGRNGDGETSNT